MLVPARFLIAVFGLSVWINSGAYAQTGDEPNRESRTNPTVNSWRAQAISEQAAQTDNSRQAYKPDLSSAMKTVFADQKDIWTSPGRLRLSDTTWMVPLGGLTAGLFATDREFSASLSNNPADLRHFKRISNLSVATLAGTGAGLYLLSFPTHNAHWRETSLLAAESALNTMMTVEALKYSMGRDRPYEGNGNGRFFQGGVSFPSEHAAAAWSIASVFAHEYQGTLPRLMAYSMATAVSLSQVRSRQHFLSDVLIGSALGYFVGQGIYRRRHDPELGGGSWQSPHDFVSEGGMRSPSFMGSPYVPLESWIYPAMERLAALGYLKSASLGMRPWTRSEFVRLLTEAGELRADVEGSPEVDEIFKSLSDEFASDLIQLGGESNVHAQIESVYQGSTAISGRPLTDGFHFGQTIWNDYGRPLQEGFNNFAGASGWATAGPFVLYVRGEYQYAPSGQALPAAALNFISNEDDLPSNAPGLVPAATHRFQLLDAYVGMNLANWQISFGRQSLWWGPSEGGAMAYTDNAAPITMFRVNRIQPFRLPGFLKYLGDLRLDLFLGQLSGQEFINKSFTTVNDLGTYGQSLALQPYLSGARISFRFTPNLELNLAKTTIYGGPGNPLTPTTLLRSALGQHMNGEALGDGRSSLDFSYRVPGARNRLTAYGEAFTEDEVSPLSSPRKSAFQVGLYAPRMPKLNRLDLRLEGGSTSPIDFRTCNGCFYHNFQYVNGYTNDGQLMGTWIGRAAQGELIRSNYWLSGTKRVGFELRHRVIDRQFLPQGGTQNDAALTADIVSRAGFQFTGTLQYEQWLIPVLANGRQSNVTTSFQVSYWPHGRSN